MDIWCAPLEAHTVVRVRGDDPLAFLEATTTQALTDCKPGSGALTCFLGDTGHVLSEFRVLPCADGSVVCDGPPAAREALTGWLTRIAPLSGCEIVDESSAWHATAYRNLPAPGEEHSFEESPELITISTVWGGAGYDELARDGSALASNPEAIERARIEDGRVRFGVDVTPAMILNETPLIDHAVSFTKGCYPGQETVAKIRNLGRPRRTFIVLEADEEIPHVEPVTSVAGDRALAFVRVEIAEQESIDVGGVRGRIRRIA